MRARNLSDDNDWEDGPNQIPAGIHWRSPPFEMPSRYQDTISPWEYAQRVATEAKREGLDGVLVTSDQPTVNDRWSGLLEEDDD